VPIALPHSDAFRLLGRIISPHPPSVFTIREFLLHAWKFASPFSVDLLPGDRLLFSVSSLALVEKILVNGP
jgi:hypothetical protein